jgi:hypothetical protein
MKYLLQEKLKRFQGLLTAAKSLYACIILLNNVSVELLTISDILEKLISFSFNDTSNLFFCSGLTKKYILYFN